MTKLLTSIDNNGEEFLGKHKRIIDAEKNLGESIENYKIFTIVRNPYSQVYSFYNHLRKPLYMSKDELRSRYPDYDGYLHPKSACMIALEADFNVYVKKVYNDISLVPRMMCDLVEWIKNSKNKISADFIIKFENMEHDVEFVFNQIGLKGQLEKLNYSLPCGDINNYRAHYDDESKNIIKNNFRETLKLFDYKF